MVFCPLGSGIQGRQHCQAKDFSFPGIYTGQDGDREDGFAAHRAQGVLGRRQPQGKEPEKAAWALQEVAKEPSCVPQDPISQLPGFGVLQPVLMATFQAETS